MKHLSIILAFLITLCSPVAGQDYDKGMVAYEANDYVTAFNELKPLAEAGSAKAQNILGLMYNWGDGKRKKFDEDSAQAIKWYQLSVEQDNADAQYNLGRMYERGQGVLQNYTDAIKLYRLAAAQDSVDGLTRLSFMYLMGRGVKKDLVEATKLRHLAAKLGDPSAHGYLGNAYRGGYGVLQDNIIAHLWFNIGAANGDNFSTKNRDKLALDMTPEAIEKAQAMARKCMESNYKECGY